MRPSRLHLVMVLLLAASLGTYWAVNAQEGRPFWPPPSVLPTRDLPTPTVTKGDEKKASAKTPNQALREKPKADATLIVPAAVYEMPRPLQAELAEPKRGVVQTGGVLPPMLPVLPAPTEPKQELPPPLPPMPSMELKAVVVPIPMPEPTKALIVDLPTTEMPKPPVALSLPTPLVMPETKQTPPAVTLAPMVVPDTRPASPELEIPKQTDVRVEKPKAFVRIQSVSTEAPPVTLKPGLVPDPPTPLHETHQATKLVPAPLSIPGPNSDASISVQIPSVTVEKRGALKLPAGATLSYQIVVRNLGPVLAQQIRVEEILPDGVKIAGAEPMPEMQGNKAVWVLPALPANQTQTLQFSLRSDLTGAFTLVNRVSVHVSASDQVNTTALRPQNPLEPMTVQLAGPTQAVVGKPAVFEIRVYNQSAQPLTGIVLHGFLPEGLNTPEGRGIVGEVDGSIAAGETKTLKMPTHAVKPGQHTVQVKVVTQAGEASATASIEITAASLSLQVAPATRLFLGRAGDLRIDLTNHTGKTLRHVAVADRLPEGLDFVAASERGLYQANSRTVYWLIDPLPPGKTQTLVVRVHGDKAAQHQNVVFAKADGIPEMQSTCAVTLEGISDLTLRVSARDPLIEIGRENVYEIQVLNPGNAPAHNVQLQVQFPAGLTPKKAEGDTRFSMDRQSVVFEPIASLAAQGQAIYRVSAVAQSSGDQRVRFSIVAAEVRVPMLRELSTRVVD